MGNVGDVPGIGDLQGIDVLDGGYQVHAAGNAPLGSFDLRVAFVSDENHVPPAHGVVLSFLVDLGNQGACGVDDRQVPVQGFVFDRRRRAVGAQNGDGAVRNVGDLFDEDGPLFAKRIDDPLVVHDLVADIDRRTEPLEGPFDDFDGALHARAKAARLGQVDGETWARFTHSSHMAPDRRGSRKPVFVRTTSCKRNWKMALNPWAVKLIHGAGRDRLPHGYLGGASHAPGA